MRLKNYKFVTSVVTVALFFALGISISRNNQPDHADRSIASKAKAPVDGTFLQAEYIWADPKNVDPATLLQKTMTEIASLGMDTVIIQSTKVKRCSQQGIEDSNYQWHFPDMPAKVAAILNEAQKHQIKVYVGLSLFDYWWNCRNRKFFSRGSSEAAVDDTGLAVQQLLPQLMHHPSFGGWYLPDEPALASLPDSEVETLYAYYSSLVARIRANDTDPTRPILVSPYLYGVQQRTPTEVAQRAVAFKKKTGVDIEVWQDSVGTASTNLKWRQTPGLDRYYYELSQALGRESTWGISEAFDPQGRPASVIRMNEQLSLMSSDFLAKRILWIQGTHMSEVSLPHEGTRPEARRLLAAYKAIYGLSGQYLRPQSYYWTTPTTNDFPTDWKMFDQKVGDPLDPNNPHWVGVQGWLKGYAEVILDFKKATAINWVAAHVGHFQSSGIHFPKKFEVRCFNHPSSGWSLVGTQELLVDQKDGEYMISHLQPLNTTCQQISIRLYGQSWISLSELEIVGP